MRRPSVPLVLCLLFAVATAAAADEIMLTNGDRFTGTVVSLAANTLTVDTPYGRVNIDWPLIASLVIPAPLRVTMAGVPEAEASIAAGDAPGRATLQPGGPVDLAQIIGLSHDTPTLSIDGGANAGFINSGGNTDVHSLRIDGDLLIRERDNRYTTSTAINRAVDRGVETARNWTAAFNYDRFLTTRLFVNANSIFTNDRFRDLDLRTALGLGAGYQVFDTPRVKLTANAGLGWVNENFSDEPNNRYTAARESATLDIFVVPERLQLFHQHDGYFGVTGDDNLFVRTKNGARLGLIGGLVTTAQIDIDYDLSPSPGRESVDRTFALTFGYRF